MEKEVSTQIESPVLVIVGPTAIGKTSLSLDLAERYACEIVSLDSMQVYRYMDIGTAKATVEERARVPHHCIDIVDPDEEYNASRYAEEAEEAIRQIHAKGKIPLITGGTGLYLRALTEGLFEAIGEFPEIRQLLKEEMKLKGLSKLHEELCLCDRITANRVHENDSQRILRALEIFRGSGIPWSEHIERQQQQQGRKKKFSSLLILGLTDSRERLYRRINERSRLMLKGGLKEEVLRLFAMGYSRNLKSMQSIGYKHMAMHICEDWDLEETERVLARDTRRYAKRQYTWFKQLEIEWINRVDYRGITDRVDSFLRKK